MKYQEVYQRISTAGIEQIDRIMQNAVSHHKIPGIVACVADKNQVLYERSFGVMDSSCNRKIQNNTIFRIASMTKPITSAAVMMLREEGKLDLDEPISKYLDSLKDPGIIHSFNENDGSFLKKPAEKEVTIRHLLTNTSGYGYRFTNKTLYLLGKLTGKEPVMLPLLHEPGTRWTYGPGTAILEKLVENLSKQTVADFFRYRILEPLGMFDTFFTIPSEKKPRWTTCHKREQGILTESPNPKIHEPNDGLLSTASDYIRFLQMFLNGGKIGNTRILKKKSIQLMTKNQIGKLFVETQSIADPAMSRPFPLGSGKDKFGLGFQITSKNQGKPFLRSPGSYGWAGIYNTYFWVDPVKEIAAVILMQLLPFYDETCIQVYHDFEKQIYMHLD